MAAEGISREQLVASPETFAQLQRQIMLYQHHAEAELAGRPVLSDRSGIIDPLAYTIWKFDLNSPQASAKRSWCNFCVSTSVYSFIGKFSTQQPYNASDKQPHPITACHCSSASFPHHHAQM